MESIEGFVQYSNLVLGHGIQCLKTNQKKHLFPSSEDYSTTEEWEHDGSESLLRCYIRAEYSLADKRVPISRLPMLIS